MVVIVLDQFKGPSPYALQQSPMPFAELLAGAQAGHYDGWNKAEILDVDDTFRPHMATTVYTSDAEGNTMVWRSNWDSSG